MYSMYKILNYKRTQICEGQISADRHIGWSVGNDTHLKSLKCLPQSSLDRCISNMTSVKPSASDSAVNGTEKAILTLHQPVRRSTCPSDTQSSHVTSLFFYAENVFAQMCDF